MVCRTLNPSFPLRQKGGSPSLIDSLRDKRISLGRSGTPFYREDPTGKSVRFHSTRREDVVYGSPRSACTVSHVPDSGSPFTEYLVGSFRRIFVTRLLRNVRDHLLLWSLFRHRHYYLTRRPFLGSFTTRENEKLPHTDSNPDCPSHCRSHSGSRI